MFETDPILELWLDLHHDSVEIHDHILISYAMLHFQEATHHPNMMAIHKYKKTCQDHLKYR